MTESVKPPPLYSRIRAKIRAVRLYYKYPRLFFEALWDFPRALWLPFRGGGTFHPRHGKNPVIIPQGYWIMLPTVCRLLKIGAYPEWEGNSLKITLDRFRFFAPDLYKSSAHFLKEIFVDDVYGLNNLELTGMTAVDVGAGIGDSSLALAARGALVHAFEPSPNLVDYIRLNASLNGFGERISIHNVGLSSHDHEMDDGEGQKLRFVHSLRYLKEHGIGRIDFLKMDCEGCEYEVLSPPFLYHWQPRWIVLEYHRGGEDLYHLLRDSGYKVTWAGPGTREGYMRGVHPGSLP